MAAPIVKLCRLGMNYGLRPVLRDVEFELVSGCGAAIIGDNGSGKSTLVKILAGLLAPSSGSAVIFGSDSRRLPSQSRRRIGLLTHQSFLYPNLTASENLEFYGGLYGLADVRDTARIALMQVGLEGAADQRVRTLSRGMEQRLAIARAMLASPELLLFDEPFAALDRKSVETVADLIRSALGRGAAIVVTAHGGAVVDELELDSYKLSRGRLTRQINASPAARVRSLTGS